MKIMAAGSARNAPVPVTSDPLASLTCWLLVLLFLLVFPVVLLPAAQAAEGRQPMVLAIAQSPVALPALIADKMGYFKAEGLSLTTVPVQVGRQGLEMVMDGAAHFATVAEAPIMFASLKRQDFSIIATMTRSTGENSFIVRSDRGIGRPADLRGKRIGVPRASGGHFFVDTFLLHNGLTTADVRIVAYEPGDSADALVSGRVDAAGLFGRLASDALNRLGPNARILPAPPFFAVTFNLVASPKVSDADSARLLRAIQRANSFIRDRPAEAQAVAAEILQVPHTAVAETWSGFDFRLHLGQPLIAQLEAQVRWAIREKLVPTDSTMPDYLDLVRLGPLRQVDPRAVRLVR